MSANIEIRRVLENELKSVFEIEKEAFQPMNYPLFVLRQYFDIQPDLFLVAINEQNKIVGYTLGGIDYGNNLGWVLSLAIRSDNMSSGVGFKLTNELISIFKEKHIDKVKLTVHPENVAALNLYLKLGFKQVDLIQDYYGDNSLRKVLELKFDLKECS